MRPSTPSSTSTNAPKSARRTTLTVRSWSLLYFPATSFQGSFSCLYPRLIRFLSMSTSRTTTLTSCPFRSTSLGCLILVQLRSPMWIRPSIPGSTSTKAPKSVTLVTTPVARSCAFQREAAVVQGSSRVCFMLRERRLFSWSIPMTFTLTGSPFLNISFGLMFRFHESSLIWTRPSMGPTFTKTPKEVMLLTSPSSTVPSWTSV